MRLVLPLPPSSNRYWRMVKGRMILSSAAREYRRACQLASVAQIKGEPIAGRVRLHADVFMDGRGDLDNRIKQLLDGMRGSAFFDDAQLYDLRMVRHLDRENPRVEVVVEEIAA